MENVLDSIVLITLHMMLTDGHPGFAQILNALLDDEMLSKAKVGV
jgi:hypothetical protein